jgi:aminopeptidase N
MRHLLFISFALLFAQGVFAQPLSGEKETFTQADTLRGTLLPERTWFDVTYYDLNIKVNPNERSLSGYNDIYFRVLKSHNLMQIDLYENMQVDSIVYNAQILTYKRLFNAVLITFPQSLKVADGIQHIKFYYSGKPTEAVRPPWDGGFVWSKDKEGNPFIGVACQGDGASLWWPNKDHQSEEPDSMRISCAVPKPLQCIANGQNKGTTDEGDYTRYHWLVTYPINNYGVSLTIGNFKHFSDYYVSDKDSLLLNYYVLAYNLEKAKTHFEQVKPMMSCYEQFLGRYPFWRDGFALVETPYLGMEHQSGIAYGNNYRTGYNGYDFSHIGLTFDYIIIHEAGHEWWGNSLTSSDIADMWIHEGFCTYSESLYVECMFGYETAMKYINAKKPSVSNDIPIIGHYGVNREGSGDMYNKGMLILNTMRSIVNNDELWFATIKGLQTDFKYRIVDQDMILQYFNHKTGKDFTNFFKQYLFHSNMPTLAYKVEKQKGNDTQISYKWIADAPEFDMPIEYIDSKGNRQRISPKTNEWQTITLKNVKPNGIKFADDLYYIEVKKM